MAKKFVLTQQEEEEYCINLGNGIYFFKPIPKSETTPGSNDTSYAFGRILSAFMSNHPELELVSMTIAMWMGEFSVSHTYPIGYWVAFKTKESLQKKSKKE